MENQDEKSNEVLTLSKPSYVGVFKVSEKSAFDVHIPKSKSKSKSKSKLQTYEPLTKSEIPSSCTVM